MNPFLINTYINPDYFCNREQETALLLKNITNKKNTTLFAQRRTGKTALIQHVFYQLEKKKFNCLYVDIYATQNMKDLANALADAIYKQFPQNKSIGRKFMDAIKVLRPVIRIDELNGNPELSLDISKNQHEKTVPQLLRFLDEQEVKVVIAFDEFQQILRYPEKNVEAILRTVIQQLKNISFVFCGSNQRLMHQIFDDAKHPFYASTSPLLLSRINAGNYSLFITESFRKSKRVISAGAVNRILELTDRHTYYTQYLCHELYSNGQKKIEELDVNNSMQELLALQEGTYFQYRNLLTPVQWELLKAMAREEKISQPYSKSFIKNHNLGTPAGVKRALESLIEKDLVYFQSNTEKTHYEVNDKFLMRWLQRLR